MEYLEIGSTPSDEDCEQLGASYDADKARLECRVFARQIARVLGDPPSDARLMVKGNAHDFGTYYEVAVRFPEHDEEAVDYAFRVESDAPTTWDDIARAELAEGLAQLAIDRERK